MALSVAWLNAEQGQPQYAARALRNTTVSMLAGSSRSSRHTRSGVRLTNGHDLEVTLSGSSRVSVAAGACVIDGPGWGQGAYAVTMHDPTTRQMPAPHATLHRIDAVYVRVLDSDADGSGRKEATIAYAPGEPAANPVPPSLYPASIYLAWVRVPPAGQVQVLDRRDWLSALGGVIRCTSDRLPELVPTGTLAYEADTGRLLISDTGEVWRVISDPAGAQWTNLELPTWLATHPSTGVIPAYRREGAWVNLRGRIRRKDGEPLIGEIPNILHMPNELWPGASYSVAVAAERRRTSVTARVQVRAEDGWVWAWVPRDAPADWIELTGLRWTILGQ